MTDTIPILMVTGSNPVGWTIHKVLRQLVLRGFVVFGTSRFLLVFLLC